MSEFIGYGRTNAIDFGDFVEIEMHRYGAPNEMFLHKVVGALESNAWIDAPLKWNSEITMHDEVEKVLNVIQCGIDETKVIRVSEKDCKKINLIKKETLSEQCISCKKIYEIKIHAKDIERINSDEHIQDVAPYLSVDERELLISRICGICFDKTFEEEDE